LLVQLFGRRTEDRCAAHAELRCWWHQSVIGRAHRCSRRL